MTERGVTRHLQVAQHHHLNLNLYCGHGSRGKWLLLICVPSTCDHFLIPPAVLSSVRCKAQSSTGVANDKEKGRGVEGPEAADISSHTINFHSWCSNDSPSDSRIEWLTPQSHNILDHKTKFVFPTQINRESYWMTRIDSSKSFSRIIHNRRLNISLNCKPACHQSPQWNI